MPIPLLPKKQWSLSAKQQLKNLTKAEIIKLLEKDARWEKQQCKGGSAIPFRNPNLPPPLNYVAIHFHSKQTCGWDLLEKLLAQICWTEQYLKSKKIIK